MSREIGADLVSVHAGELDLHLLAILGHVAHLNARLRPRIEPLLEHDPQRAEDRAGHDQVLHDRSDISRGGVGDLDVREVGAQIREEIAGRLIAKHGK